MRAEKAALRLIARAEQSSFGLAYKLQRRGHENACASAVISRLASLELVDDIRYARLWLESRLGYARSPRRLLASLCARGIGRETAEAALKTALDEEAEFSLLKCFTEKKLRNSKNHEQDRRSIKYLLRAEGFSSQAIERYFDSNS
jgi:regulatory protein